MLKVIKSHFEKETLDGDNKYLCSKCGIKVKAERYVNIKYTSKYLIICFKRFSWDFQTNKRHKIMTVT